MATTVKEEYFYYENGAYELKQKTMIEENATVAKTEKIYRSITGPISRKEVAKMVENIDLNSPDWEEEMKAILGRHQFIVHGINSTSQKPESKIGMTKAAYISSYFNWKSAVALAASAAAFLTPGIIRTYFPATAKALHLPEAKDNQNIVSYSMDAWTGGINEMSARYTQLHAGLPPAVNTVVNAVLSYAGYKGLESLMENVVKYPAADYRTWTALNMQKFLETVYPQIIPDAYKNDKVLSEITDPSGNVIRSPFKVHALEEFNRCYEEHVLKNILHNQKQLYGKLFCPVDGKTEIQEADIKRDECLSDRIELRLLLLDAHAFKNSANT